MKNSLIKYQRKITGVELKLGFLYIPAIAQSLMPKENGVVKIQLLGEVAKDFSYNTDYKRVFGLTSWYKKNNVEAGTLLNIEVSEQLINIKIAQKEIELEDSIENEDDRFVDITGLSSIAKGNIVEDRIKELILLYGQGLLDVYKPVIDQGGIDLIVIKSGTYFPIYLQVKSRFNVSDNDQMILTISGSTFKEHHSFYLIGASFNPKTFELDDRILFLPSKIVAQQGIKLTHKENIRIVASYKKTSNDQWASYFIDKKQLVDKLLEKFIEIETYLK